MTTARNIKAQRGDTLRCLGWRQETVLRMLENNLENGERPEDLVVYTSAKAARDWPAFDKIVAQLKTLREDETLLIQSGKPVARFPTHGRAPLVIMANGNVLGRWSDPKNVYQLEGAGLTINPGMTAAAWQYIGSQGILQGTYQSFRSAANQHFAGDLAGRIILTAGLGGMGGAQPLAGKLAGAAILVVDTDRSHAQKRIDSGYLDVLTDDLDEAVRLITDASASKTALSVGLVGNAVDVHEELLSRNFHPDIVTDQCNTDLYRGYAPSGMSLPEIEALRASNSEELARRAGATLQRHARALLEFQRRGSVVFEYGNGLRLRAADLGVSEALALPSFVTEFIRPLFCQGIGPFRWLAISGDPADIAVVDDIVLENFPADHDASAWIRSARDKVPFQGLPSRIGWLGYQERSKLALLVNQAVRDGKTKGPIAFTRDHLDSGSVSNPVRETEKMPDGSDAISDWPLLNALLACSGGADVVAIHSGDGRWQSAGQTTIADGSLLADDRLKAVLDGDTGIGIVRHAEAGYDLAQNLGRAKGLTI